MIYIKTYGFVLYKMSNTYKWMWKESTSKKVPIDKIEEYKKDGWMLGRNTIRGSANPFFNKRHTEESKQKMSEAKKDYVPWNAGKPMSDDTKVLLSRIASHKMSLTAPISLNQIRKEDIKRLGFDGCTLTESDLESIFEEKQCKTCGRTDVILTLGIRDAKRPHTRENCFCQCQICFRKDHSNKYNKP